MVERTESYGIGRAIVAVPYREVPFIFRIELSRMEGCQSSRTGAYFIDAVAEAIDAFAQVVELPAVDGIFRTRSNVAVFDIRNGRVVHVHTIIIDGRPIVDGDGVDFDIFVQADFQVTARSSGSDILIVPFDTEFAIFAEDGGIATVVSKFRFDDGSCALGRSGCGSTRCCTAGAGIRFCRSIKGNGVGAGVFEECVDGVGCAVGASALVQADAVTGDEVNRGTLQLCYVDSVCKFCTCCNACDLTGYTIIGIADRYSPFCRSPNVVRAGFRHASRHITGHTGSCCSKGFIAEGDAAILRNIGIETENRDVTGRSRQSIACRAYDDGVFYRIQRTIIAQELR